MIKHATHENLDTLQEEIQNILQTDIQAATSYFSIEEVQVRDYSCNTQHTISIIPSTHQILFDKELILGNSLKRQAARNLHFRDMEEGETLELNELIQPNLRNLSIRITDYMGVQLLPNFLEDTLISTANQKEIHFLLKKDCSYYSAGLPGIDYHLAVKINGQYVPYFSIFISGPLHKGITGRQLAEEDWLDTFTYYLNAPTTPN